MAPQGWKAYRDFVLKIEPDQAGGYRVEAQGPSGEGETTFLLPFDEKDLKIFLLEVSQTRKINIRGAIPQPARPTVDFGKKLFNSVFSGNVRDTYMSARTEAEQKGYGLRVRLRLVGTPELADLPWEYLYDGRDFLALSGNSPLVRYIDLPSPPRPFAVRLPLRILVTISDPHFYPVLDVEKEKVNIERALRGMTNDQKVELVFTADATLKTLQRTLQKARSEGKPFHIWHFIGHGGFDPASQAGQLALCDSDGLPSMADGFQLGTLFNTYPEIRLVLLNACEGARNSPKDPFAGVAASLVERGIPAVIGMQFEITDTAAITFSEEFYSALVNGLPVDAALTEARRAVFFMPNWIEWATPVLFMRSPDGILFNIQSLTQKRKAEGDRLAAQIIEQELLEKERDEAERLAKEQAGIEKLAAQQAEQVRLEQERSEAEKRVAQEAEAERLALQTAEQVRPGDEKTGVERQPALEVAGTSFDQEKPPSRWKASKWITILALSALLLISLSIFIVPRFLSSAGNQQPNSPRTPAAEGAALLDLGGRTITVAVSNDYPPYSQVDKASAERVGWDYDAVREICKRLNCVPEFKTADWYDIHEGKAAAEYDLLADGVPVSEELEQPVEFSIPYLSASHVLVARTGEPAQNVFEFLEHPEKIVAVRRASLEEQVALYAFPDDKLERYGDMRAAAQAVISGAADGAVIDSVSVQGILQESEGKLTALGQLTSDQPLAFAFPQGSPLVKSINAALEAMQADGTLAAINKQWGLSR